MLFSKSIVILCVILGLSAAAPFSIQHASDSKSIGLVSTQNQEMANSIAGDTVLPESGTSSPDARRYYIFPRLTSTVVEQTAFANMLQALGTTVKYSTIMDGNGTGEFMMWMITLTTEQATKLKGDKMVSGFCW